MFALIDVNSMYTTCESVFRPDLKGKPIICLSNNDGCVIARSTAAKPHIRMGAPYFEIKQIIKQKQVTVFSSNYPLYADFSNRFMAVVAQIVPQIEVYSIDECFCNLTGMDALCSWYELGHKLKEDIFRCAHLPVGVGISSTKTLAKLANHAAKTWKKTGGVVDLSSPSRQKKLMALVPVGDVWGIGRKLAKRLNQSGIETALDLSRLSTTQARQMYSVVLERTVRELNGESCLQLEEIAPAKQQIICSRSFGQKVMDYELVRQSVCAFAERAAEKLREEKQHCRLVTLWVQSSHFSHHEPHYYRQKTRHIAAGEKINFTRTDKERGRVMNSDWTVSEVSENGHITIAKGDESRMLDPNEALADQHLDYGYAGTAHKAQGASSQFVIVLGGVTGGRCLLATQRDAYVGLSRTKAHMQTYSDDLDKWTNAIKNPGNRQTAHDVLLAEQDRAAHVGNQLFDHAKPLNETAIGRALSRQMGLGESHERKFVYPSTKHPEPHVAWPAFDVHGKAQGTVLQAIELEGDKLQGLRAEGRLLGSEQAQFIVVKHSQNGETVIVKTPPS